jgi:uncharacterized zinc-type alcohol dehydrogenase-like protein
MIDIKNVHEEYVRMTTGDVPYRFVIDMATLYNRICEKS